MAVYWSLPGLFQGRDVIHFIDNYGALAGLTKGYSGDRDSARLVHAFYAINDRVEANVWFAYVPSGANISDLPSRSATQECIRIIFDVFGADSEWVESVLPPDAPLLELYLTAERSSRKRRTR